VVLEHILVFQYAKNGVLFVLYRHHCSWLLPGVDAGCSNSRECHKPAVVLHLQLDGWRFKG